MIKLHDFQEQFVADIGQAFRRHNSVIGVAPTGSGKTVCMASIVRSLVASGNHRVLIACHREKLVDQTSEKLSAFAVHHGIMCGPRKFGAHHKAIVGTVQTLIRYRQYAEPTFLIFDEAHLSRAAQWEELRGRYPQARLLGLSATPTRLSGEGFADMYRELVSGPSVSTLMERGFLSRYRAYAPETVDLSGVKTVAGDYSESGAAEVMTRQSVVGDAVDHWLRLAKGRTTMAFCVNRRHAEIQASRFRDAGVSAEAIDGSVSRQEQRRILERFGRETPVLCSVALFTEGFDRPDISAILDLRPTQSLALHLQKLGRGLRVHPGKDLCIILDHVGNIGNDVAPRHGFPDDERVWTLEPKKKRKGKDDASLPAENLPRVCPECSAVNRATVTVCTCGYQFALRRAPIKESDGQLVELTAAARIYHPEEYGSSNDPAVESIIKLVRERGWKPGAVQFRTQALFEAREAYRSASGREPQQHWNAAVLNSMVKMITGGKTA